MPAPDGGRARALTAAATLVVPALLACAALALALPFRARVLAQAEAFHYSWDAALHVLAGLDLWDDVRRGALLSALGRLVTQHWWGPLWALLTAPFHALFGPGLASATLPSLLSFAAAPGAAWLFARRATGTTGLFAAPFVLVLFLRSPLLLEASAWPMFESTGGFLSLGAWLLFARGTDRARRAAYGIAGALFFLKYHYGVFLGATLLLATLAELPRETRRDLGARLRAWASRPGVAFALIVVCALGLLRLTAEKLVPGMLRFLPSLSNLAWGTLVLLVLAALLRPRAAASSWRALPRSLRHLALFAAALPSAWLLDPANVRAFWRQIHQDWVANPPGPLENGRALLSFFRDDYVATPWTLPLLALGIAAALALGRGALRWAALFALWPPLAMCFSAFPVEPRFLGCLLPALDASAAAGLLLLAARVPARARLATVLLLFAALLAPLPSAEPRFRDGLSARVRFPYPNPPAEDRFVAGLVTALPEGDAVVVALPPGLKLGPTIRLALRLSRRDLPPRNVLAEDDPPARLFEDVPRSARRVLLASEGFEPAGFTRVERRAGPPLPDGSSFFIDALAR